MAKQNIIKSAFILTFCGIVCRLLGAFYRVPQASMLGSEGMGSYYLIFPIFSFMISLSSSSIPQALSKLVAENIALGNTKKAKKYFICSIILMSGFGLFCTLIMTFLSPLVSKIQGNFHSLQGYFAIAPAILFVCLISCFRGYFQGRNTMTFSGISQIIEQIVKVCFGLFLTNKLLVYGVEYGVFGSLIAITVSEIFAVIYLFFAYLIYNKKQEKSVESEEKYSTKICIKQLIKTAFPFTLSYIIFPLSLLLDSLFVVKILTHTGIENSVALSIFGLNNGVVSTLTNLPIVVSTSLAAAIVPSVSYDIKNGQKSLAQDKIMLAIKIGILFILPCVIMFAVFPREIIYTLFGSLENSVFDEMQVSSNMLILSSIGVLFLGVFQISTAILQASNKFFVPVKTLGVGVLSRFIVCVALSFVSGINIYAVSIANVICFVIIAILNMSALQKEYNFEIRYYPLFVAPMLASGIMVFVTLLSKMFFASLFSQTVLYLVSLVLGGFSYMACLIFFRAFEKREIKAFLKG